MAVTTTTLSIKDGSGASQTFATATDPAGVQRSVISLDTPGVAVYRASATFTPVNTADRTLVSIKGSATKTVRIKKICLSGTTTASGSTIGIISRTTALGSGGTAVNPTISKVDSGTVAAATAVVAHYTTAAQSLGSSPTTLATFPINTVVAASAQLTPSTQVFPEPGGNYSGQAIVLRGTSDFCEIGNQAGNLNAGASLYYMIEWEEDAS